VKKIKVLVVDDSALVRKTLSEIFNADPELEVIATAADPYLAVHKIQENTPDVITLDIEMPKMDGLTFLKKLMSQHPIPVVVISTLTEKGADTALQALDYGAVEVIGKPKMNLIDSLENQHVYLCELIKTASQVKVHRRVLSKAAAAMEKSESFQKQHRLTTTEKVVAIAASTGGTEALKELLIQMPEDCPGIAIVQHMPEMFTKQFATRLNQLCKITVKEAEHGEQLLCGHALIAPGGKHIMVKRNGAQYYVEVLDGPPVNRHRPSADVLFRSVARYVGNNAIGVILTGMGADGANGLLEMKEAGAYNIAQDEKTCVVFGMPKEAIKLNAIDNVLPLNEIAGHIIRVIKKKHTNSK
jgi:two-component system, chemotaxis family, protein-glutamate methylesterase/glutaminase